MTRRSVLVNVAAAALVPFVLQSIFVVIAEELGASTPGYSNLGSHIVNALVGFAFLVRAFRYFAIAVGVVYVPAMVYTLVGFSVALNSAVHDNSVNAWRHHGGHSTGDQMMSHR